MICLRLFLNVKKNDNEIVKLSSDDNEKCIKISPVLNIAIVNDAINTVDSSSDDDDDDNNDDEKNSK